MVANCKGCGKGFNKNHKSRQYCSDRCKGKAAYLKKLWKKETHEEVIQDLDKPLKDSLSLLKISQRDSLPKLSPVLHANFDAAIVITDIHVPFHSEAWIEKVLRSAYQLRKKMPHGRISCLIGGDLIDLSSLSDYGHNESDASARESIKDSGILLRALYQLFDKIYICAGNHDMRFTKKLKGHLGFQDLMKIIRSDVGKHIPQDDLLTTGRNFLIAQDRTWAIVHPKSYSRIATTVPRKLAELHQINVISGHTHHPPSYAPTASGRFVGLENGCLQDRSKVPYLKDMDMFPQHMFGFTILMRCPDGKTRFKQISEQDLNHHG